MSDVTLTSLPRHESVVLSAHRGAAAPRKLRIPLPSAVCVYRRRIKAAHKARKSAEQQELEKRIEKRHTVHTNRTAA